MRNIYEILKDLNIGIDEEKKEVFEKDFNANYKTIKEVEKLNGKVESLNKSNSELKTKYDEDIAKRDEDLQGLQKQLEEAGVSKTKLDELNQKFSNLQKENEDAKTNYEKQLASQKYEFAIRELANELKFSSNSAKELFLQKAKSKELQMEDGKVLGFDDFVSAYKEQDEQAFAQESKESEEPKVEPEPKPHFGGKTSNVEVETKEYSIPTTSDGHTFL